MNSNAARYEELAARMRQGYISVCAQNGTQSVRAAMLDALPGLRHDFSTRLGGVSPAPYDSLNLSWSRVDPSENVVANFKRFCAGFSYTYEELAIINFEHGANVLPLTRADCGRGFDKDPLPFCDALITDDPMVTLVTSHADCGALFFYDPRKRAVGMAHAGWKGTLARIGARVVERMGTCYGCAPEDIVAAIGPCICRDCFEVDIALAERFAEEFGTSALYSPGKTGKGQLDLSMAAALQLLDAGVRSENITVMRACTYHQPALFFSYRRDKGETGSMSGFIKLV